MSQCQINQMNQINQINQISQDLGFVFDVVSSFCCFSLYKKSVKRKVHRSVLQARCCPESVVDVENPFAVNHVFVFFIVHLVRLANSHRRTLLLHATAELHAMFLFLTVRPPRQSRRSFTKK